MTTFWRVGKHSRQPRMWLTFPYDSRAIEALKEVVPGIKWDRVDRMWTAPLDMEVARDVRSVARMFSAKLKIEPELAKWALAERDKISNLLRPDDLEKATDTRLLPSLQ